jgi:hypothetical protein
MKKQTRKHKHRKTKKGLKKNRLTRKIKYGGDLNEQIQQQQKQKNLFRRSLNNFIIQINNKKNTKQALKDLSKLFENNQQINTLIPITENGKPVDKETYSLAKRPLKIYDFVSPVSVILDNLTNVLSNEDIIKLLNIYYKNGGNFNNLSSRFKESPIEHEIKKQNINNIKLLLNKSNQFHIIEDGLNTESKAKLAQLIPNEQVIRSKGEQEQLAEQNIEPKQTTELNIEERKILQLPFPLPENNEVGYDRNITPQFWNSIFDEGELISLREKFMGIYEFDRYTTDQQKRIKICDLLEKMFPGYLTKYVLSFGETAKTLINMNILNCFITLLYGIILYKLYDTKQDYIFIFKGGRALQLSLVDIIGVKKYFSEDTDILIIPNPISELKPEYNYIKMENLSGHIAYLIKWFIPEEINLIVSLPTNPKNQNKEITKLLYNDNKLFKALSDIGFGEMSEDIKKYFDNLAYFPFYVDDFDTISLFITPTIDDILSEKLYFYAKYSNLKQKLINNEQIKEKGYDNLTEQECNYLMYKFKRAILHIVESIIKRDYSGTEGMNIKDTSKLILRGIIGNFDDYSNEEKERIINEVYPQY